MTQKAIHTYDSWWASPTADSNSGSSQKRQNLDQFNVLESEMDAYSFPIDWWCNLDNLIRRVSELNIYELGQQQLEVLLCQLETHLSPLAAGASNIFMEKKHGTISMGLPGRVNTILGEEHFVLPLETHIDLLRATKSLAEVKLMHLSARIASRAIHRWFWKQAQLILCCCNAD